jgi:hypothetical protein
MNGLQLSNIENFYYESNYFYSNNFISIFNKKDIEKILIKNRIRKPVFYEFYNYKICDINFIYK